MASPASPVDLQTHRLFADQSIAFQQSCRVGYRHGWYDDRVQARTRAATTDQALVQHLIGNPTRPSRRSRARRAMTENGLLSPGEQLTELDRRTVIEVREAIARVDHPQHRRPLRTAHSPAWRVPPNRGQPGCRRPHHPGARRRHGDRPAVRAVDRQGRTGRRQLGTPGRPVPAMSAGGRSRPVPQPRRHLVQMSTCGNKLKNREFRARRKS